MIKKAASSFIVLVSVLLFMPTSKAQPFSSVDLYKEKPTKYINRKLISEKSTETNFGTVKHFLQNTFTHYNFYFNANNKVQDILNKAKQLHKDDYTQLLPFYNYSLENTAKQKTDIDSIIYKVTAAVLLHDLRDDWVDNMYMLMGKTYLLKNDLDSAGYVFQWVNYAWAPKSDGYDIPIGSNISNDKGIFSISTIEKRKALNKILGNNQPSRNESFVWRLRVLLEQNRISNADGLIAMMQIDPYFPKRLQTQLHEMEAYSYYKQQVWDSAAWHLIRALPDAENVFEKARWEYLIAQMLHLSGGKDSLAATFYEKSIVHTTDPLMEIFARLNLVSLDAKKKGYTLKDNIAELYKLGRKDRFALYRDVIYYAAGKLELENRNLKGAITALKKGLKYENTDNPSQKQKTFLLLADTYFDNSDYKLANNYYDSIQMVGLSALEKTRIDERIAALKIIVANIITIETQDSLQHIADMPENVRRAYIKKLLKQLRKDQGVKEGEIIDFGSDNDPTNNSSSSPIAVLDNNSSGVFYFNNPTLVAAGSKEFKSKWGNRPNVDNWGRQSAFGKQNAPTTPIMDVGPGAMDMNVSSDVDDPTPVKKVGANPVDDVPIEKDLTFEGLMRNVPLRQEQKDKADTAVSKALISNGITFQNNLKDYQSAINNYESFLNRFPNHKKAEQVHFNLIYCYGQLGLSGKSDSLSNYLRTHYPNGIFTALLLEGHRKKEIIQSDTTVDYQTTYLTFAQKEYQNANIAKLNNDKKYGKITNWTPQSLYIESIDYILKYKDTTAINRLQEIVDNYSKTPLAEKAIRMIELLRLRLKYVADSINTKKREDHIRDSIAHINLDSLRKVHIVDSLNKLHYDDSLRMASMLDSIGKLKNVDSLRRVHLGDSIKLANLSVSLRKQHTADSLKQSSLANALRRKELEDASRKAALADRLHKQHIADSLRAVSLTDAMRRKRIADSLKNASLTNAKWKKYLEDSLRNAQLADAMRRKHIADSLRDVGLANAKWKKHLEDSLRNAQLADAMRRKHISDSLRDAGLANAKWKKHLEDSLRNAQLADAIRRKHITDSLRELSLADAKWKKHLADSLGKHYRAEMLKKAKNISDSSFIWDPNESHYAAIQLDDVIRVFIKTAASDFNKYDSAHFPNEKIEIASNEITDRYSYIYFGPLNNAAAAVAYINKIKPDVSRIIIPWLPKSRFKFTIISESNLILLQQNKKVDEYNKFLKKFCPYKF